MRIFSECLIDSANNNKKKKNSNVIFHFEAIETSNLMSEISLMQSLLSELPKKLLYRPSNYIYLIFCEMLPL